MFNKNYIMHSYKSNKTNSLFENKISEIIIDNHKDLINIGNDNALIIGKNQLLHDEIGKVFKQLTTVFTADIFDGKVENIDQKFDAIFVPLVLHKVNHIEVLLKQINNLLEQKGVLFSTMFGSGNLFQLAESMFLAYQKNGNKFINHFLPVVDIKDYGNLLQKIGFKNVITSTETFKKQYQSIHEAFEDIKNSGERNCLESRLNQPISRKILADANDIFLEKHRGVVECNVVFGFCGK